MFLYLLLLFQTPSPHAPSTTENDVNPLADADENGGNLSAGKSPAQSPPNDGLPNMMTLPDGFPHGLPLTANQGTSKDDADCNVEGETHVTEFQEETQAIEGEVATVPRLPLNLSAQFELEKKTRPTLGLRMNSQLPYEKVVSEDEDDDDRVDNENADVNDVTIQGNPLADLKKEMQEQDMMPDYIISDSE